MSRCLVLLLFVAIGAASRAPACMNDYKPNIAAIERSHSVREQLTVHPAKEPWPERRDRLRKELAEGGDFRVKNDLATTLAHVGEAGEAVTLLEQIEAEKPGLYFTAANLGTAYELAGNDLKALEWIRKGIERNPEAHDGTEWLHVRILEAKLALSDDPKWLESNSIFGGRADSDEVGSSALGNHGEKLTPDQVKAALIYQLHERLQFVTPPDAIVGALLLDLGELISKEPSGIGGAADVFKLAVKYLGDLPSLNSLQERAGIRSYFARRGQRTPRPRSPWRDVLFLSGLAAFGGLLGVTIIGLKRWIQRRLRRSR